MTIEPRHCAIYTRKSHNEGLEQKFNSLDAQREAGESYISSQKHEGWRLRPDRYDDGGISGGTMERPALKRLLADIRIGKIDIVVVYKVDRLTRALSDFAKMVEIFDRHGVSFVSVTQQFNTTTSMGRLTLNVLLSFAQFEREVTSERIRDKIAASLKKGMWMGGLTPLGYDAVEKKLLVNEEEAEVVRLIFRLYLDLGSANKVMEEAERRGLKSKYRVFKNGRCVGGKPITPGHIYKILSNTVYVGDVRHLQNIYPGEHEGIIDRETWESAQRQLLKHSVKRHRKKNIGASNILAGLLRDDSGRKMIVKQSTRRGRRYRYYVSDDVPGAHSGKWRLPAKTIEAVCIRGLSDLLDSGPLIIERLGCREEPLNRQQELLRAAASLGGRIADGGTAEQRKIILKAVERIEVRRGSITIRIRRDGLAQLLFKDFPRDETGERAGGDDSIFPYDISVSLKKRGVEKKFVITDDRNAPANFDTPLIAAVAKGHKWFVALRSGRAKSVSNLAAQCGIERTEVGRILQLGFLAPDIVAAILAGRQPMELTATRLRRIGDLPVSWEEQRRVLGFK